MIVFQRTLCPLTACSHRYDAMGVTPTCNSLLTLHMCGHDGISYMYMHAPWNMVHVAVNGT